MPKTKEQTMETAARLEAFPHYIMESLNGTKNRQRVPKSRYLPMKHLLEVTGKILFIFEPNYQPLSPKVSLCRALDVHIK